MRRGQQTTERRQFGRRPTALQGEVLLPCRSAIPCIVKNTSREGALIEVDPSVWLPTRFVVVIDRKHETGCTVQHRTSGAVGVRLDKPMPEDIGR